MPKCLVLNSGSVISERNAAITIESNFSKFVWRIDIEGRATHEEIPEADVNTVINKPHRKDLPWSTYYPQSSSPANLAAATISPTQNTHKIQQLALRFQQELLRSLLEQVTLMQELLDVKLEL